MAALILGRPALPGTGNLKRPPTARHPLIRTAPFVKASFGLSRPSISSDCRPTAKRRGIERSQLRVRAQSGGNEDLGKDAVFLRRVGWVSFWTQLALSIVSACVIFFTLSAHSSSALPPFPVLLTLGGVVASFISTFFAYGYTRVARRVIIEGQRVKQSSVVGSILVSSRINTLGMAATLLGLQASVGQLVGKTLASSTSNPYAAGGAGISSSTPTAIDVFSVQASTNTLMAHAISIFFANWLLRSLNKDGKAAGGVPGQGDSKGSSPGFQGITT